ncbi:alanine racemase [Streptosporangium sp. 'caverna']|uniref:alanine racemase n=1 Tax=Streptosporangium sp. 'caverna' TaxID=2202249 RepID=UPI000D7E33B4|nr:alanine racemase [Streptosporangium sp. 'caverna']AWS43639.1 hypothetical protein DKM19_21990 [Streptosporangium sp. 'caverna']
MDASHGGDAECKGHDSPILELDLDKVRTAILDLQRTFRLRRLSYAVKANPHPGVLLTVRDCGGWFDIASVGELRQMLSLNIPAERLVVGMPVQSMADITTALSAGVKSFVADSAEQLERLATAGASKVALRLSVPSQGSRWPLSEKFGATPEVISELARQARDLNLTVEAITFHVGSQAESIQVWRSALRSVGHVLQELDQDGIRVPLINLGGGFPVPYEGSSPPTIEEIGAEVDAAVAEELPYPVALAAEPGRFIVAAAGTIHARIIGTAVRSDRRWLYLNVGCYNGLFEAGRTGGAVKLPVRAVDHGTDSCESMVLAGPSCDGDDVMEERMLPAAVTTGDRIRFEYAGAYSLSYATPLCGLSSPIVQTRTTRHRASWRQQVSVVRLAYGQTGYEAACELEFSVFRQAGFLDDDGTLDDFRDYGHQSVFTVVEENGELVGALREILSGSRPFKTLIDLPLAPAGAALVGSITPIHLSEIGTLAVRRDVRGRSVAEILYAASWAATIARGGTHWLASIDAGLLEAIRTAYGVSFVELGSAQDYYGSPTVPVLLDLRELVMRLSPMHQTMLEAFATTPVLGTPSPDDSHGWVASPSRDGCVIC